MWTLSECSKLKFLLENYFSLLIFCNRSRFVTFLHKYVQKIIINLKKNSKYKRSQRANTSRCVFDVKLVLKTSLIMMLDCLSRDRIHQGDSFLHTSL